MERQVISGGYESSERSTTMQKFVVEKDLSYAQRPLPEKDKVPVNTEPLRVLVREGPGPGLQPVLGEASFEDARSIAAARKSRAGGYLRLPLAAVKALGKSAVLLE